MRAPTPLSIKRCRAQIVAAACTVLRSAKTHPPHSCKLISTAAHHTWARTTAEKPPAASAAARRVYATRLSTQTHSSLAGRGGGGAWEANGAWDQWAPMNAHKRTHLHRLQVDTLHSSRTPPSLLPLPPQSRRTTRKWATEKRGTEASQKKTSNKPQACSAVVK